MKKNNNPIHQIMDAVHVLFVESNKCSRTNSSRQSPHPDFISLNSSASSLTLSGQEFFSSSFSGIEYTRRRSTTPINLYVRNLENIGEMDNQEDSTPELDKAINDLNKVVKDLFFDFCVDHLWHYEDYKNIYVMLAFLTSYADKLFIENAKKIKKDEDDLNFKINIDQLVNFNFNSFNNQTYLEFLVSSYIYHLLLEQVYFEYLKCTHDPVFERLFVNGFSFYLLMKKNIPSKLMTKLIHNFDYPVAINHKNDLKEINQKHPFRFIRKIDDFMINYNLWRLFIVRFRRFYLNFQAVFNLLSLNIFVSNVEPVLQRSMSWLNFLYFIPRVTTDLCNFFCHVFCLGEYFKTESPLPLKVRFFMQVNRRWESFLRDMLWFVNGILSLFILFGSIGFIGLYVNAFMQFAETLLNIGIYFSFQSHQNEFLSSARLFKVEIDTSKKTEIFAEIQTRWNVDNQIRLIRLKNSVGILISSLFIMPCMSSIHLMIPFCGAVLGLIMTFVQFKSLDTFNNLRKTIKDPFIVEHIQNRLKSVVSSSTLVLA